MFTDEQYPKNAGAILRAFLEIDQHLVMATTKTYVYPQYRAPGLKRKMNSELTQSLTAI